MKELYYKKEYFSISLYRVKDIGNENDEIIRYIFMDSILKINFQYCA